jgi:hypothetical protein
MAPKKAKKAKKALKKSKKLAPTKPLTIAHGISWSGSGGDE